MFHDEVVFGHEVRTVVGRGWRVVKRVIGRGDREVVCGVLVVEEFLFLVGFDG